MPRIRNVKPSLWKHEILHDAEYFTGLPLVVGFISLWSVCDKEGRFKWKIRSLKSDCMPLRDDVNFEAVLESLVSLGMVSKYCQDDEYYGVVENFVEHQALSTSEKQSKSICLKGAEKIEPLLLEEIMEKFNLKSLDSSRFPEGQTKVRLKSVGRQTTVCQTKDVRRMTYDLGQNKNTCRQDEKNEEADPVQTDWVDAVASESVGVYPCFKKIAKKHHENIEKIMNHWSKTMNIKIDLNNHPKINTERARLIESFLVDGYTLQDCLNAVTGCYGSKHHMGQNQTNTKYNSIQNIFRTKNDMFNKFVRMGSGEESTAYPDDISDDEFDRINREFKLGKYATEKVTIIDGEVIQQNRLN